MSYDLESSQVAAYALHLKEEERAEGTIEKYLRDVRTFAAFVGGRPVDKTLVAAWKEQLLSQGYSFSNGFRCFAIVTPPGVVPYL